MGELIFFKRFQKDPIIKVVRDGGSNHLLKTSQTFRGRLVHSIYKWSVMLTLLKLNSTTNSVLRTSSIIYSPSGTSIGATETTFCPMDISRPGIQIEYCNNYNKNTATFSFVEHHWMALVVLRNAQVFC